MNMLHKMKSRYVMVLFGLVWTMTACSAPDPDVAEQEQPVEEQQTAEQQPEDVMVSKNMITATVTFIDLEGGFFGLTTEDGEKLLPSNLPKEFHKDGTVIQFHATALKDMQSIHQWGTLVELKDVKLVQSSAQSDL